MGLKEKETVVKFYQTNFNGEADSIKNFLHPDVELAWYGTTGFRKLNLKGIADIIEELKTSFESLRVEVEKTVTSKQDVAIHFTYHVRTIENPEEEMPLAHFVAIWELKDGMLYKGVQISQLGEEIDESPWN